jgi:hypothetical protein
MMCTWVENSLRHLRRPRRRRRQTRVQQAKRIQRPCWR